MAKDRLQLTWYNKDKALIPTQTGRYGYTWVAPSDPRSCETHTLVFDDYAHGKQSPKVDKLNYSDRADLEPQNDNLLILGESGDVLETLTRVPELADKYTGKVKLIYIDPPFNTAQTFTSYEDNLEHSIWLTMMRDRLVHMRKLLARDGSIWVHLDYAENHRMRLLLDEVFGSSNFVAEFVWQKADSPRSDVKRVSIDQDVILCYAGGESTQFKRMERSASDNARFKNPDGDSRGIWFSDNRTAPHSTDSRGIQVSSVYGIIHPITGERLYPARGRQWAFKRSRILSALSQYTEFAEVHPDLNERSSETGIPVDRLREDVGDLAPVDMAKAEREARARLDRGDWPEFFVTETSFGRKSYPPEEGQPARSWWSNKQVGHNRSAKSEIKALFPGVTPFSTPKPERLLERILYIGSEPGDIVLDVFAGSGTTAAVAQKMGRRWVTCELIETTFNDFTRPRLEKVVHDQDAGGITFDRERVVKPSALVPDKFEAEDLQEATDLLNAIVKNFPVDEDVAGAIAKVKKVLATGPSKTRNWRGGGGFQVAHLSPACFDYDPELDRVLLTPDATGQVLVESVAANLGFRLLNAEDGYVFDARKGNSFLKVIEGAATTEIVDWLVPQLRPGETIVLAATSVMDGVREYLRKAVRGSRVVSLPDDIFRYSSEGV
ncbi:DNA methylase [Corynebacterium phocae]|uniref:DNA methylase n=1 Tax=Corynebacterium phocae TaxID=161895 RepID=A0A1L7D4F7_9CORY|nr:site-specific DNA-methyltransferase [Corynebacterium phocae]APT93000.1 DNA methylase [Corynebacterium phocae]KAA8723339.1 site-specific DNA-methyltransferase [Corynebacterium phocae]